MSSPKIIYCSQRLSSVGSLAETMIQDPSDMRPIAAETKKAFIDFAVQELAASEIAELVKISSCIIQSEKVKIPEWYLECNGKFYFKDGKLI